MNRYSKEKEIIIMKDEFLKYRTVFGLFKNLYNICKMLNADKHFDYCYCNCKETKTQCWLCKFAKYVRCNYIKKDLLRYRKNEERLLDIAYKFRFYIVKMRRDMEKDVAKLDNEGKFVFDFFNQKFDCGKTSFDEVIRNDILKFKFL